MKACFRVKKSEEFGIAIKNGKALNNDSFTVHILKKENQNCNRVGISISSKLGNAVVRSKAKRQVRAMCDQLVNYEQSDENYKDIIIIIRKNFLFKDYFENKNKLSKLLTGVKNE